jgi:outer membrane protein assembly factor BamB
VDADRIYVAFATPAAVNVTALDHAGKVVWEADLGPYVSQHGYGPSPILHDGLLILPNDQDKGGSLVALDPATGKVRWRIPRKSKNATYSTPCVRWNGDGRAELIFTNWQLGMTAVDPADGTVRWSLSVFDTGTQERAIGSPVVAGDLVLATSGFTTGKRELVAVAADGRGGAREVWRLERGVPHMPTPLVKGELVFLCNELGIATCVEAATGKVRWQKRLGGNFSASPVCAGERIYCVADDGTVHVLAASATFERLGTNRLGGSTQATPAIARGKMFFRTAGHLLAVGAGK